MANNHSSGKDSEKLVFAKLTNKVPYTAPRIERRPPKAQKITISMDGTMPTKEGDMKPTCKVNMAPPIAEIIAAKQKTKILKLDTS